MQTEEGKNIAEEYNDRVRLDNISEYRNLLGSKIYVHEASEPTDIIWENRYLSDFSVSIRAFIFLLWSVFILFISFMIIYTAQKKSLEMNRKYPHQVCQEFIQQYEGEYYAFLMGAIKEYQVNNAIEENDGFALYTGPLQCFCKDEKRRK